MIKIAALNEDSEDDSSEYFQGEVATKEAQEEEAIAVYNRALKLQNENDFEAAEKVFQELLGLQFVASANAEEEDEEGPLSPILMLKYSSYKNLGSISTRRGDYMSAAEAYLQAVEIDSTDVSLWYRIGVTAKKMHKYPLARLAFEQGLKCNPNHWSSLDNVITVLYVQNDYAACLYYISQALERETFYVKGLAIRDQIYKEHPTLRMDFLHLFKNCDECIFSLKYDLTEGETFVKEALALRAIKRELEKPPEPVKLVFNQPWRSNTWQCLGENIIGLYDHVKKSGPPLSLTCQVDLKRCLKKMAAPFDAEPCAEDKDKDVSGDDGQPVTSSANPDVGKAASEQVEDDSEKDGKEGMDLAESVGAMNVSEGGSEMRNRPAKRGRRRKWSYLIEYSDLAEKRRSARVRNTSTRKQQENVDYTALLKKFLPSSLTMTGPAGDPSGSKKPSDSDKNTPPQQTSEPTSESETTTASESDINTPVFAAEPELEATLMCTEEADVKEFVKSCDDRCCNLLDMMYYYLIALGRKHSEVWPKGLTDTCYRVFVRFREHSGPSSFICADSDYETMREEIMIYFVNCQFEMSKWVKKKNGDLPAPQNSRIVQKEPVTPDPHSKFFSEDLMFLLSMTANEVVFGEFLHSYVITVWWLRAHFEILQGDADDAAAWLEAILERLRATENKTATVKLVNCKLNNVISVESVNKLLESMQRRQSLEEVQNLYEQGHHEKVVELLTPTFNQQVANAKNAAAIEGQERHSQLLLLLESLEKLGDQQKYLNWAEESLDEGINQYLNADGILMRNKWACTLIQLFGGLEKCISGDPTKFRLLARSKMIRLTHNLIRVISTQMETTDSISEMPINSVLPWILLYRLIDQEEKKIKDMMTRDKADVASLATEDELATGIPSPLMLLYNAHQYLGRRSWCCNSDGALLLLYVNVLFKELRRPLQGQRHPFQEDLEQSIEQCFYCLYGHPSRKSRSRHLQEHGSPQIALTWQGAEVVYEYFKPQCMPEFDNYKINTVTGELENLLRRILTLVPTCNSPGPFVEKTIAYIDGLTDVLPANNIENFAGVPIVHDLFYLLGDYYFKYKEQSKAIRFYLLDLCVEPDRFDSWAGMALARSSQLEYRLNTCEARSDGIIFKKTTSALRCFKRALELNHKCTKLWIEHGSLAYIVHAYCSRQLKMLDQFGTTIACSEPVHALKQKRDEMLEVASDCFENANRKCHDGEEEWLHHYMLGKVAEKTGQHPKEYLFHYRLAAWHLHEDGALYPKKIPYHNPPHLSMEALEVYFRIHASVLKYLMDNEGGAVDRGTYSLIKTHFEEVAAGNFATFQDKRLSDAEEGSTIGGIRRRSHKIVSLPNDHDYFRRKRKLSTDREQETDTELPAGPARPAPSLRQSVDSSSESQDSATVKDLLFSLVSVVSEKLDEFSSCGKNDLKTIILVGDARIAKSSSTTAAQSERVESATVQKPPPDASSKETKEPVRESASKSDEKQSMEVENEDVKDVEAEKIANEPVTDFSDLVQICVEAMKQCLHRFPQHYKSLFRLAFYYSHSKKSRNLNYSRDYLIGPSLPWQQTSHMPCQGLFSERKNTNFFNGIWRIPTDEIDRPGSFNTHMFRSVLLLIEILQQQMDYGLLLNLTIQLYRTPDTGKKYLKDPERIHLASVAYERSLKSFKGHVDRICREKPSVDNQAIAVKHLLELYKFCQLLQKLSLNVDGVVKAFEDGYKSFVAFIDGKVDAAVPVFEQAASFCQQQQFMMRSVLSPVTGESHPLLWSPARTNVSSVASCSTTSVLVSPTVAATTDQQLLQAKNPMLVRNQDVSNRQQISGAEGKQRDVKAEETETVEKCRQIAVDLSPSSSSPSMAQIYDPNRLTAQVQSKISSLDTAACLRTPP